MKYLLSFIVLLSFLISGFSQTNLSAVMADTNGVVQRPTNFATANFTNMPTNVLLFQTNAFSNQSTNYFANYISTLAWHANHVFKFFVPYATSVTNGAASLTAVSYFRRAQTTNTNSTIFVNGNPNGIRFGNNETDFGIVWSRPVWLVCSFNVKAVDDAVIRIQLGGQVSTGTNIGPLQTTNSNLNGMGLIFTNGSVFVEANHGGTNQSVSSNAIGTYNTNIGSLIDIKLRSSGTNSIAAYFNGVFITNLPFGPTNNAGNTATSFNVSISSGTSTNVNFIDLVQDKISVIVE